MERQDSLAGGNSQTPEPKSRGGVGDIITSLLIAAAIAGVLLYLNVFSFLKVLMGLSFVIFIHELGHFLVAKWCDVNVSHFSIGFGPVIPGLSFQGGETKYQICLLPLGGYVQMLGQVDGDESSDGSESDPRSYRNKSVGQRMAIISAGVIMNAILALVCFIAIYRGPGKDRIAAVVYAVDGGAPAFVDGVRTGMEIQQIGHTKDPYFDDLRVQVMSSNSGEKLALVARRDGDPPLDITIEPRKGKKDANPVLGIQPGYTTRFHRERDFEAGVTAPVEHSSPASRAKPPFAFDDVIVGASDPKNPTDVIALPDDPRKPEQKDYFEFDRRMQLMAGKDVVLRVKRASGEVDITVPPAYRASIGAIMQMGHIVAVRKKSPADGKIQLPESAENGKKFLNGDLIEKVVVTDADGQPKVFEKEDLDPERLPFELKAWARRLAQAGSKFDPAPTVTLFVRRHSRDKGLETAQVEVPLAWDNSWTFDHADPISLASPLAIPELGLAYQVRTTVAHVRDPKSPLMPGDVITHLKITNTDYKGKSNTSAWKPRKKDLGSEEWAHMGSRQLESGTKIDKIELKVERDKKTIEVEIVPTFDETWPLAHRGWLLRPDMRLQKADTTLEAIGFGLQDTQRTMYNVLRGIWQMITNRIDWSEHLGGPITIARIAYNYAGQDIWEFLFFLGMISINLAVINFLPIPLLDGGHMVFLIYEKLRGKPASEGVRVAATYVGLAFIACLILLVSYLDIGRLL